MAQFEDFDAIVIGAGTRGLIATYVLSTLGFRAALVDRAPDVGSGDGSFKASDGTWFDYGMHVLDDMRSPLATRLFRHICGDGVQRTLLKRAIVLREFIVPYAPAPAALPAPLRQLLRGDDLVDDIGDRLPTRELIGRYYGPKFADLIYDEVLPSYPSEHRHLAFGVDESQLLVNIYPWFFPRARRTPKHGDISRTFHDKLRSGIDQYVLYPREGGFVEFGKAFVRSYDSTRIEVVLGLKDLEIVVDAGAGSIDHLRGGGRTLKAARYFWAGAWPELCKLLKLPCQNPSTDRIALGSFRLNRPALTSYNEILVGNPAHAINRVYFPGAFRGGTDPLMQIEFSFPVAENRSLEPDQWRDQWLESLRALGILDAAHRVEIFDFKTRTLHFNGYGMEGERLRDADPALVPDGSNVFPIVPSMANLNLNAHLPMDVAYVTSVLAREL